VSYQSSRALSAVGHAMPTAWAMDGFQNVVVQGLGLRSVMLPVCAAGLCGGLFRAGGVAVPVRVKWTCVLGQDVGASPFNSTSPIQT
jgi:hypothetical protein